MKLALPIQTPIAAIVQTGPHNHSANYHNPFFLEELAQKNNLFHKTSIYGD